MPFRDLFRHLFFELIAKFTAQKYSLTMLNSSYICVSLNIQPT